MIGSTLYEAKPSGEDLFIGMVVGAIFLIAVVILYWKEKH